MIAAIWFGGGVFLMLASTAAFRVNPVSAPDFVGAMLTRWHYIALAAPLLLIALEWRRLRTLVIAIMFAAIVFAAFEALLDIRIHAMRMTGDRRGLMLLHGISMSLLLAQVIAAGAAVGAIEKETADSGQQTAG